MQWLRDLQALQGEWQHKNFGPQDGWKPLLGVVEEVGELSHAHLKMAQGIRSWENLKDQQQDAIGDIVIYLMGYCNAEGLDLAECIKKAWDEVSRRNWRENPDDAHLLSKEER